MIAFGNTPPIAQFLRAMMFGNGADGDVTISSGTTTLTRDMCYRNLTLSGTGVLNTAGYRVFVSGILDISAAPAGAMIITSAASFTASLPFSVGGKSGASGGTGAGTNGTAAGGGTNLLYGGYAGTGGNGGASGTPNAGGTGGTAATSGGSIQLPAPIVSPMTATPNATPTVLSLSAGIGGASGASGGGDGVNNGGAGGNGGSAGGSILVVAATIARGSNSTAAIIQAKGSTATAGSNGAGGTAGGGGGSYAPGGNGGTPPTAVTGYGSGGGGGGSGNAGAAGGNGYFLAEWYE